MDQILVFLSGKAKVSLFRSECHHIVTLAVYRKHRQGILEYFKDRPEDLLIMDFAYGDGWDKLCSFLSKEIPDEPFPHANKRNTTADLSSFKYRWARVRKSFKNNFKIWMISARGLWPDERESNS